MRSSNSSSFNMVGSNSAIEHDDGYYNNIQYYPNFITIKMVIGRTYDPSLIKLITQQWIDQQMRDRFYN